MNSKRKFVLTVCSFFIVLAMSVTAVTVIFAAKENTVNQNIMIKYTAVDVSATVKANYTFASSTKQMLTESGEDSLVFVPESTGGGSFAPENDIMLDLHNNNVVFEYMFANNSDTLDIALDLDLTELTVTNMILGYSYSYSKIDNIEDLTFTENFEPMIVLGKGKENQDYSNLYVYLKISVDRTENDASFDGNLSFRLTRGMPVKLSFENVDGSTNEMLFKTRYIPSNQDINSLPSPIFEGDDKQYVWYTSNEFINKVSYPINTNSELTVYAAPLDLYTIEVLPNGTNIVTNNLDRDIYVSAATGSTFYYDSFTHTINANEYLLVGKGQKVCVNSENVNYSSNSDLINYNVQVSVIKPEDVSSKLFYAAYGRYPQTYVGNSLNEVLKNEELITTGRSYTNQISGETVVLVEYIYNGELYAKLDGVSVANSKNLLFTTGDTVENNMVYFFKVEPVISKAMQENADGTYSLMSVINLFSIRFDQDSNDWQTSDARNFLNNIFLYESGLNKIVIEQNIKNDDYFDKCINDANTNDKIYLPSAEEMIIWSGNITGIDFYIANGYILDDGNNARKRGATDFALATNTNCNKNTKTTYYFLRSPGINEEDESATGDRISEIYPGGYIYSDCSFTATAVGICPVFAVRI